MVNQEAISITRTKEDVGMGFTKKMVLSLWYHSNFTTNSDLLVWVDIERLVNDAAISDQQIYRNIPSSRSYYVPIRRLISKGYLSQTGRGSRTDHYKYKLTPTGLKYAMYKVEDLLELGLNCHKFSEEEKRAILNKVNASKMN